MAWIEKRRRRYCVITRVGQGRVKGPTYADRADAELFVRLANEYGWQEAIAYVTTVEHEPQTPARPASIRERAVAAGASDDPQALPFTDPLLPAPPGREPSGVSVGELVRRHIATVSARPKTIDQYHSYVRDHVDPFFGDLDAAFVIRRPHPKAEGTNAQTVTDWRAWLLAQPVKHASGRPTGRTLQPKTVKNVMSLVATAFDDAMNDDFSPLVAFNPVTGMAPTNTAPDEVERPFLSPRQFLTLHEITISHYQDLLLFMVLTGLRWGETAGLRVRDVTLHAESGRSHIDIRVALKRVKGGTVLGLLKSRSARRRLTIPDALVPIIAGAIAGKGPDDTVFTSPRGKRLHHGNVTRNLKTAIERAQAAGSDIPDFTLHALRHTAAAWLLSSGRTPYQVSRQLGHETEATTQKYYGHLVRGEYDANADALQDVLVQAGWELTTHSDVTVQISKCDMLLEEIETSEILGDEEAEPLAA